MSAYVVVDIEVTDPVRYEDYKKLAPPSIAAYGGKYLARGGKAEALEGDWLPARLVILEFASVDQAKKWVNSQEYSEARKLRQATARSKMVVIPGV